MKKVIKFNFADLNVGDDIYDCTVREWRTVTDRCEKSGILTTNISIEDKNYVHGKVHQYSTEGIHKYGKFQSAIAIRKTLKPEDVETCDDGAFHVRCSEKGCMAFHNSLGYLPYGTKKYTKENARLLAEILNEGVGK